MDAKRILRIEKGRPDKHTKVQRWRAAGDLDSLFLTGLRLSKPGRTGECQGRSDGSQAPCSLTAAENFELHERDRVGVLDCRDRLPKCQAMARCRPYRTMGCVGLLVTE